MASTHVTQQDQKEFADNKMTFIVFSVVFLLGIAWTILGDSSLKIVFIMLGFIGFLRAGINMEMSARKLDPHAH